MVRAVVTGASSGIGAAFAEELGRRGTPVLLVGRDAARLAEVAARVPGGSTLVADLSTDEGVAAVCAELTAGPVSLLVNNAGTGGLGALQDQAPAAIAEQVRVNLTAVAQLTAAALPGMLERGTGGVVFVSSSAVPHPTPHIPVYTATKEGTEALARSLRADVGRRGVRITVVRPGYTRTAFHERQGEDVSAVPEREWVSPQRVARAALDGHDRGRVLVRIPDRRLQNVTNRIVRGVLRRLLRPFGVRM
ncbi:SDR family NAD(P)-dependent oxidoreductase [Pseudonocardia spirodelae]|uniref:SDR family NAD(P)-dependent oxidoreductase n=1 Tax=Pseudonocardia spirodelae TaxID=3133431 RepID=A0ABU8T3U5_9PSEU